MNKTQEMEPSRKLMALVRVMGDMPVKDCKQIISIMETLITIKIKIAESRGKTVTWRYAYVLLSNGKRVIGNDSKRELLDAFGFEIFESVNEYKRGKNPELVRMKPEE